MDRVNSGGKKWIAGVHHRFENMSLSEASAMMGTKMTDERHLQLLRALPMKQLASAGGEIRDEDM